MQVHNVKTPKHPTFTKQGPTISPVKNDYKGYEKEIIQKALLIVIRKFQFARSW